MLARWMASLWNSEAAVEAAVLDDGCGDFEDVNTAFVSHEDVLLAEEWKRYGEQSDRFTSFYYPQSRSVFAPTPKERGSVELIHSSNVRCCSCNSPLGYFVARRFRGDREYCVQCLRRMGCSIIAPATSSKKAVKSLCHATVARIMSFIPEYYQVARLARVCKLWLGCFNLNCSRESDIMALKRYWISRELYFQYEHRRDNKLVIAFENRFELGALLGEWTDGVFKPAVRWLNLCRLIVESAYFAEELRIRRTGLKSPVCNWTTAKKLMLEVFSVAGTTELTVRIPTKMLNGSTIALEHDGQKFIVSAKDAVHGHMVELELDPLTGIPRRCGADTADNPTQAKSKWRSCTML